MEAGAQGGHKVARGYLPEATYSAHWISDPSFRDAVKRFLEDERRYVASLTKMLTALLVAVTVLPAAARRWLSDIRLKDDHAGIWSHLASRLMSLHSSTGFSYPCITAWIIARPISRRVVTYLGNRVLNKG